MDQYALARKVQELAAGDAGLAREFVRILIDTNRATLETLREALNAGSWKVAASAAHRINGSARLIGFEELVERTVQLESAATARHAPRAAALFAAVEQDVGNLETWLENLPGAGDANA
ncbi:Hpt domain-containing protein [Paraburkholderia saeva]|uniref:HPt domain-containing protein n=1 Tax=Paraburkholderia saeva TaxID=2777537 RepID=A0A9N8X0V3_9BURK|nr:Hpt domain-containing protein [Paraburkholderia saeva]CAG4885915.1 hypothetical protein R52603_00080 [Paraburkholderia saeva]CAG4893448.1 hypothetical protein LMG31841_01702 [Paraburkholderia saeva]CAG4908521.1 hypothetical protein R70241_03630 [Paraburkholderia saeva]